MKKIFVLTGEPSGDKLASEVISQIKTKKADLQDILIKGLGLKGGNGNGIVEPLELGIQEWENGRLVGLMCGAYIYCQLSGNIPDEIENLSNKLISDELNSSVLFCPNKIDCNCLFGC